MSAAARTPRKLATKILSPDRLARQLRLARKEGHRLVFTNGCFDILHPGHVRYLQQARAQGDRLVVALNTDESVRTNKDPSRPINELSDRLQVIAALESVDYVTWFGEVTPLKLILKLRPDVLVKGGDWKVRDIVGGPEVEAWGGIVKSLAFVDGKSTTRIIQKTLQSKRARR